MMPVVLMALLLSLTVLTLTQFLPLCMTLSSGLLQVFPDFVNIPEFPQCTLTPGNEYRSQLTWKFSVSSEMPAVAASG